MQVAHAAITIPTMTRQEVFLPALIQAAEKFLCIVTRDAALIPSVLRWAVARMI